MKVDVQQIKQRFGIIGNNPGLNRAIDVALQVAPTDLSVLITGESGVGKETFPQIIHQNSQRKHGQYIAVNCGAIPEGTIDSELFGHEKGSFTGALADRKGYFEVADGGTIFLDEVGELPTPTQARLLRVLETGEFIKVGSSKVQKTNVRIVAATNVNLVQAVSEGKFREDLYYRLNTVPIQVPPLRERPEDIVLLFRKFASDCAEKYRMPPIRLDDEARQLLVSYRWPGNVRELKNITERISVIEETRDITADVLRLYLPNVNVEKYPTQARLLRVLETGEFIKVGSSKVQKTNVRIVAATNVNLVQAVSEGKFREDLYYRLNTVPIQVPPLRERPEDIVLLFRKFASDCAEKYRMPPIRLDDEARQLLVSYRWPGNVRELKNITERISVIEETRDITADVLRLYLPNVNVEKYPVLVKQDPDQKIFNSEREILYQVLFDMKKDVNELKKLVHDIMGGNIPMPTVADDTPYAHPIHPAAVHAMHPTIQDAEDVEEETLSLEEVEKEMIRKALEKHNGRRKNAAADLKISERTLYRKIKEYNLE